MPTYNGDNGSNTINGGNGDDTIFGNGGNDSLDGGNGNDVIDGGDGNDTIVGGNGNDTILGGSGDDNIDGGNGNDTIDGGDGNDTITGNNGNDVVLGGAGNDILNGANGDDDFTGGAGDDTVDGGNGFDVVRFSGYITDYTFSSSAGYLHIFNLGGAGPDGHDKIKNVERLIFADRVIDIGSGHNRPIAVDDNVSTNENVGTYSSGAASVLANDFDFDGDALSVIAGTFVGIYGTLTMHADGTYSYTLSAAAQALAQGENGTDSFNYTLHDNDGNDTGTLTFHIAGVNDAPTANPDTATAQENQTILVNVLGNDSDVDHGALLTVISASVPSGQGTVSVVANQVRFDPGTDFDHLAVGASVAVHVNYSIQDEHGAASASTLTITVTGTNDAPVANPDTGVTGENAVLLSNVRANDTDIDDGATLTVTAASAPPDHGSASVVSNQVRFDPGTDFDHLAAGTTEDVVINYAIADEHGAVAASTLTITVTGVNDGPTANPDSATTSENSVRLIDVAANDIDPDDGALLTVTAASAPPGQGTASVVGNQVRFDPGTDFDYLAFGESVVVVLTYSIEDEFGSPSSSTVTVTVEGRDEGAAIIGTNAGETLVGTDGDDTITALGGDDIVFGLAGNDQIDGGDGGDILNGDADDDFIDGGNDDDTLFGGTGNDQLFGQAGSDSLFGEDGDDELTGGADNDSLGGGGGDDTLSGGDGDDNLSGGTGVDTMTGGAGNDTITADASTGAQTVDAGDGDDSILVQNRNNATTITTGAGVDSIGLSYADQGSAEVTVTDFTAGAGGDMVRLTGDDGALLDLLVGWDGSSNPFGSGFLRLQQSGADTLLQWDRNGATGGAHWETLMVFQGTTAGDFTDANFVPGYDPTGGAPAGGTITGTADADVLIGTIGADTINALGGDDNVFGQAGADTINGGDGFDILSGDEDNDVIDGGNDDDTLFGGTGNDQLLGQAGNDSLFGEDGDDQLTGGADNDNLSGGAGDDTLSGGDGDDSLSGGGGVDTMTAGAGNDNVVADASSGAQTVDAGDGDDSILVQNRNHATTITTGAGVDSIGLSYADQGAAAVLVTDFTAGAGGDMIRLSGDDGALLDLLTGWDGSSNPFGSGFLRLQQSGADTLLQWDRDGTANGASWSTLMVFQGTTVGDFTDANFAPGYDPGGGAPAGETITGTADADVLLGTIGADTINALGGDDNVSGMAGADTINGGDGFDILNGDEDNDIIDGGNDDDFLFGGDGNDQLFGQAGSDSLFGEAGNDQMHGGLDGDNLNGGDGNDSLDGGDGDDFMTGGSGSDVLTGGAGFDTLTGDAGSDTFAFGSAGDGPDEISDFAHGADKIQVSASGFGGGLTAGGTVSLVSGSDPTASNATGQFLFDTDDGRLFWDADGTGGGAAVLVATLSNVPILTASDFSVI